MSGEKQPQVQLYASPVNPIEIDARIDALVEQRDRAANESAVLRGKLALAQAQIKELRAEVEKRTAAAVAELAKKPKGDAPADGARAEGPSAPDTKPPVH